MVDFHMGDELVCFSISSLMEHLEDLLILLLEDLILHRYLIVLNLQLIDFSLRSKLLLFLLSLLCTRCKRGVILCVVASFAPHVGNTRCTWFTQIGYVHGVEEFSLIVKGLHKYIGSSSTFVSTIE
ncbi:hypothetical protein ACFX12_033862 [Malus domestica]